ncbi:MAG: glycosyltransferase family 4 protein [Anaerolineae bacterium]|nr:glycosyltransferase family 4 protein [Anaerolineae bacterium]
MRILILGDKFASSARRTALAQLLVQLDERRIQAAIAALRAQTDDLVDTTLSAQRAVSFGAVRRLTSLLRTLQVELLHVVEQSAAFVGILAARYTGTPVSIVCERVPLRSELPRWTYPFRKMRWQLIAQLVQRILVPSELLRRDLSAFAEIQPERISVVYPMYAFQAAESVDRAALGLAQGRNVALIVPENYDEGYLQAVDVLERLRKRGIEANLVVIGEGATLQALRRETAGLALPIRWFPDRSALPELLAACDVVLDCTAREALPEGLIAAMLAGKPIVAPRQTGITEVLEPNVAALIVTPADVSDMALQVSRVLQYDTLAERLAQAARKRALERFTPEAHARAMTEFFETTIYSTR